MKEAKKAAKQDERAGELINGACLSHTPILRGTYPVWCCGNLHELGTRFFSQTTTHTEASEMEEIKKNKRKKALAALAEMEAAELAAGSVNEDDGADEQPKLSKKEMKELKKKQAKQAEKEEKKQKKKAAKKLGLSVEEYEAKEAAGELDH